MKKGFLFLCLISIAACTNLDWIGSGKQTTREFTLKPFQLIEFNDNFDIELFQDTASNTLVFEGGENLLQNIDIEQTDEKVTVTNHVKMRFSTLNEKIKLRLPSGKMTQLRIFAPITLTCKDTILKKAFFFHIEVDIAKVNLLMNCDYLYFVAGNTSGNYAICGKTMDFRILTKGTAIVDASQFKSKNIYVESNSTGNCFVNPLSYLSATIKQSGNIYYTGQPDSISLMNINASGKLIKL